MKPKDADKDKAGLSKSREGLISKRTVESVFEIKEEIKNQGIGLRSARGKGRGRNLSAIQNIRGRFGERSGKKRRRELEEKKRRGKGKLTFVQKHAADRRSVDRPTL